MGEWISVKDIAAPKDKPFLAYVLVGFHCEGIIDTRTRDIQVCYWREDWEKKFEESCNCSGPEFDKEYIEVTHWMPLPEPPKD